MGAPTRLGTLTVTNAHNVKESAGLTVSNLLQSAGTGTTTFDGAVDTNTVAGVQLTANNITVNNTINTSASGVVTFTNSGLLTVNGNIIADGAVTQNGAGLNTITSPRTITTTGDIVSFATGVTLSGGGLTSIDTTVGGNAAGANITFTSALKGTTGGAEDLTLNSGTGGDILFNGAVGSTRLGAITVTNARNVSEANGLTAASFLQVAGTGTTLFTGAVNTNAIGGVKLTTNVITVNNTITTTGNGVVTFTNAGQLTINGDISADGAVTQNGAGLTTITSPRTITTTGDAVSFATDVTLSGAALTSIDTTTGGNATGANITFTGKLNGSGIGAEKLTLNSGSAGDILFTGAVGGITRLGDMTLTNAHNVTESAGLTATSFVQSAGTGTTLFTGAVNTNAVAGVQVATNAITVNNTITTTGNGVVTFTNSGLLTLNGNITADGAVTQTGTGLNTITSPRSITTTGDVVSFATGVTLNGAGLTNIDTTTGGSTAGANITFTGSLKGTTSGVENLTLNAGTGGDILFTGAVGSTRLGAVTITNAHNVKESAGFMVASLLQSAGSGTTTFNGAVDTNTVNGVQLTTNAITVNDTITTTGSGVVTFNNAGLLTINGDITSDGAVTQIGAGLTTITSPRSITTTGDIVSFATGVTLNGAGVTSIDTTSSGANPTGGTVTFASTLTGTTSGAEKLTLNTGSAGDIFFTGAVGATRLGDVTITNAHNVTETAGFTATSLKQSAGTGLTKLDGAVNTNTALGVQLTTNAITLNNTLTTTGSGVVTFTNAGLLTINGNITSDGAVTQNGAGLTSITSPRTITTTGDAVSFATGVTLNGAGLTSIDTTSGGNTAGGNITFNSTLTGTTAGVENLTLNAGSAGDILFTGAVGATRLGAIAITNAHDVSEKAGITAASLVQTAGTGVTTFDVGGAVNTNTVTGVQLNGTNLQVNAGITTTGNGVVTINESGTATFLSTGTINAAGPVSITATGGITTAGNVTTTNGNVAYNSAVTLSGDVTVSSGTGNVTFDKTIDGQKNLTINSGGITRFNGLIGAAPGPNHALQSLTTDAAGSLEFNFNIAGGATQATPSVTTVGNQTYHDATVKLFTNTALSTKNGSGPDGTITIDGNVVNGTSVSMRLIADTTGSDNGEIHLNGNIGTSGSKLSSLELFSKHSITLPQTSNLIPPSPVSIFADTIGLTSTAGSVAANSQLSVANLYFSAKTSATFGNTSNDLRTVAGKAGGNVTIRDGNGFKIGTVQDYTGKKYSDVTSSALTTLRSDGAITGGLVKSNGLIIENASQVNLTTSVATLTASGGTITIKETDAITLTNVKATGALQINAGGKITATNVSSTGSTVGLNSTGGGITVGQVSAASALNLVTSGTGGDINETGKFSAQTLTVSATGNVNLANDGHTEIVNDLASLGAVTRGGDFALTAKNPNGGPLTIDGAISDGASGSQVKIVAFGGLTLNNTITLNGHGNHVSLDGSTLETDLLLVANDGNNGAANDGLFINGPFAANSIVLSNGATAEVFATNQKDSQFNGLRANYFAFGVAYGNGQEPAFNKLIFGSSSGATIGFVFYNGGLISGDLLAQFSLDADKLLPEDTKKDTLVAVDQKLLDALKANRKNRKGAIVDANKYGPFEMTGYDFMTVKLIEDWNRDHPEQKKPIPNISILEGLFQTGEPMAQQQQQPQQ